MEKLLVDAKEARVILGDIGEKAFRALNVPARWVNKRKKYHVDDLKEFARNLEKSECPSLKEKAPPSTGMISRSKEPGFAEARKQRMQQRREQSKPSYATKPSLELILNGSRA